jgi:hypothetical protein
LSGTSMKNSLEKAFVSRKAPWKRGWQWAAGRRNSYDEAYFAFRYKLAYLSQEQIGKQSMKRKQAFTFQYSATVLPKGLLSWLPQTPLIEHLFLVLLALLDGPWSEKRCNILHQPPSIELSGSQIALWKNQRRSSLRMKGLCCTVTLISALEYRR